MIDGLESALMISGEPGLTELRSVLLEVLGGPSVTGRFTGERTLNASDGSSKRRHVYRLGFEIDGAVRTFVAKRLHPVIAQRNQMVGTRWLPAADLGRSGPTLLGVAAEPTARYVWHIYEDLGDRVLDIEHLERSRVEAAVEGIARLHIRFADHPLLPECRMYGQDLGMAFYLGSVRDAIRGLESLRPPCVDPDRRQWALRDRLLQRLYKLRDEGPCRARRMADLGGPETLLHGDLWPRNIVEVSTEDGVHTRLIDWDKAGVGSLIYDLSTFIYRFASEHRPWILDCYERAIAPLRWRMPPRKDLNRLLQTAEISRIASCLIWPCIEAIQSQAEWAFESLADMETWFEASEPAL